LQYSSCVATWRHGDCNTYVIVHLALLTPQTIIFEADEFEKHRLLDMQLEKRSKTTSSQQAAAWQEEDEVQYERPLWQKKRFWIVASVTSLLGSLIRFALPSVASSCLHNIGYAAGNLVYRIYQRKTAVCVRVVIGRNLYLAGLLLGGGVCSSTTSSAEVRAKLSDHPCDNSCCAWQPRAPYCQHLLPG
jgi:hypothetical protein